MSVLVSGSQWVYLVRIADVPCWPEGHSGYTWLGLLMSLLARGSQWVYLVRIADVLVGQWVTVGIPG